MRIAIVIPRLNKRDATELYTAMLIERFAPAHEVWLFSSSLEDIDPRSIHFVKVPVIPRPVVALYLSFLIINGLMLAWYRLRGYPRFDVIHSPGPNCLFMSVSTQHFCQAERLRLIRNGTIRINAKTLRQRARLITQLMYFYVTTFVERWLIGSQRVQYILCGSDALKREVVQHYRPNGDGVLVIGDGVDAERFHPRNRMRYRQVIREQYEMGDDIKVLVFVANSDWERKGLDLAINTLAAMGRQDTCLLVVGRGDRDHYKGLADDLGCGDRIIFSGEVRDVEKLYSASDIFFLPTLYDTFNKAALEAMASGLPVVISKKAGIAEYLRDGEDAILLPDPKDIANNAIRLSSLLEDESYGDRLGASARKVAEGFSWDAVAQATLEVYQRIAR